MNNRSENEGFRMLDDFVCKAILAPGIRESRFKNKGKNEGVLVVEELPSKRGRESIDKGKLEKKQRNGSTKRKSAGG